VLSSTIVQAKLESFFFMQHATNVASNSRIMQPAATPPRANPYVFKASYDISFKIKTASWNIRTYFASD